MEFSTEEPNSQNPQTPKLDPNTLKGLERACGGWIPNDLTVINAKAAVELYGGRLLTSEPYPQVVGSARARVGSDFRVLFEGATISKIDRSWPKVEIWWKVWFSGDDKQHDKKFDCSAEGLAEAMDYVRSVLKAQ